MSISSLTESCVTCKVPHMTCDMVRHIHEKVAKLSKYVWYNDVITIFS